MRVRVIPHHDGRWIHRERTARAERRRRVVSSSRGSRLKEC